MQEKQDAHTPWIILADAFGAKGHADQVKKWPL